MAHSAGGGSVPAFPSLTQLKSHHSQREIKDRVRKRDCGFCLQDEKPANQFSPPTRLPILKHYSLAVITKLATLLRESLTDLLQF